MTNTKATMLSARAAKPVSAFRIFKSGINRSLKGDFTFDSAAAESVMARYAERGQVLVPIDLEHLSSSASNFNPDSQGYCKLELRGGELWACEVQWGAEGLRRLSEGRQRYFSPLFYHDAEGRVTELVNIGLVADPALHDIPPLAASRLGVATSTIVRSRIPNETSVALRAYADEVGMKPGQVVRELIVRLAAAKDASSPDMLTEIRELLKLPADADREAVVAMLDELFAADEQAPAAGAPPATPPAKAARLAKGDAVEVRDPLAAVSAIAEALGLPAGATPEEVGDLVASVVQAAIEQDVGTEPSDSPDDALAEGADPKKPAALTVASLSVAQLHACRVRGVTPEHFVLEMNARGRNRIECTPREPTARAATALSGVFAERAALVGDLVRLGVEFPHTAWEGLLDGRKRLCSRLAREPISVLRDRVAQLKRERPPTTNLQPPTSAHAGEVARLSAATLAEIKRRGMTPEQFIEKSKNAVRRL